VEINNVLSLHFSCIQSVLLGNIFLYTTRCNVDADDEDLGLIHNKIGGGTVPQEICR
jgi:hypothetical protein